MTLFEEEVEDEDRDKWIMWFDGMSNALCHGVGAAARTGGEFPERVGQPVCQVFHRFCAALILNGCI